jgi:hypothetical protein
MATSTVTRIVMSANKKYILDTLGIVDNCVLGFSPYKRLTKKYTGDLIICTRLDDLEVKSFGTDSSGNLNQAAIVAWAGVSDVGVNSVANQTNTSYPAYQATASLMPKIVKYGTFVTGGLYFDGSDDILLVDNYAALNIVARPFTIYTNNIPRGSNALVFSKATSSAYTTWQYGLIYASTWRPYIAGANILSIAATTHQINRVMTSYKTDGNNVIINTNKTEVSNATEFTLVERVGFKIGNNSSKFTGEIKSLLIFNSDVYSKYTDFVNGGV